MIKSFLKKILPSRLKQGYSNYKQTKVLQREKASFNKKYSGSDVFCPICEHEYRIFAPFGIIERKNARCHNCGSLERHRLIYLFLSNKNLLIDTTETTHLLHFAPEVFFYNIFSKSDNIEYKPCDLLPKLYEQRKNPPVQEVDVTQIPYPKETFDFILCNHVLEHVPDDKLAMKELHRVLKTGGAGIFQVPVNKDLNTTYEDPSITTPEGRLKAFGQSDHVRWYGRDYQKKLEEAGFNVSQTNYIDQFSDDEIYRYGLMKDETLFFCKKLI